MWGCGMIFYENCFFNASKLPFANISPMPYGNFLSHRLTLAQTGLKRESDNNGIKCELAQIAAAKLIPNETYATANVGMLAH